MIARIWRAAAEAAKADAYQAHFAAKVAPHLKQLTGHQGAYLLRREADGTVEILAVTLWDSVEAIQQFAGPDPTRAIVEPEGRAVLSVSDDFARHYDVAYTNVR